MRATRAILANTLVIALALTGTLIPNSTAEAEPKPFEDPSGATPIGEGYYDIEVDEAHQQVFVTTLESLVVLNYAGEIVDQTPLDGPVGLAIDGDFLYVALQGNDSINRYDTGTLMLDRTWDSLDNPTDLTVAGDRIWFRHGFNVYGIGGICSQSPSPVTFSSIDLDSGALSEHPLPGFDGCPQFLSDTSHPNRIMILRKGELTVYDVSADEPEEINSTTFTEGEQAYLSTDGETLYNPTYFSGVKVFDADTLTETTALLDIPLGRVYATPSAIGLARPSEYQEQITIKGPGGVQTFGWQGGDVPVGLAGTSDMTRLFVVTYTGAYDDQRAYVRVLAGVGASEGQLKASFSPRHPIYRDELRLAITLVGGSIENPVVDVAIKRNEDIYRDAGQATVGPDGKAVLEIPIVSRNSSIRVSWAGDSGRRPTELIVPVEVSPRVILRLHREQARERDGDRIYELGNTTVLNAVSRPIQGGRYGLEFYIQKRNGSKWVTVASGAFKEQKLRVGFLAKKVGSYRAVALIPETDNFTSGISDWAHFKVKKAPA